MADLIPPGTNLKPGKELLNKKLASLEDRDASLQTQITTEQKERIAADQAHANAANAHKAEQIEYASGVSVKQKITAQDQRIDNIIGGPASSAEELKDVRLGADGVARATAGAMVREIHAKQLARADQTATIKRGLNVVQTDQASPAKFKVIGCTRCNILGNDGGCESLAPFTVSGAMSISQTQVRSGNHSIKATSVNNTYVAQKDYSYPLDTSKRYFIGAWVYIESFTSGPIRIRLQDFGGGSSKYYIDADDKIIGAWQFVQIKIPTANSLTPAGFRLLIGAGSVGTSVAYFDEIRLFELSTADYNAIGTVYVTGEQIDAFLPHVDGVKHAQGVALQKSGKNLLSGTPNSIHANVSLNGPYDITLNATGAASNTEFIVKTLPNTTYAFKVITTNSAGASQIVIRKSDGSVTYRSGNYNSGTSIPFTTDASTTEIYIRLSNSAAGTFTFSEWQLEPGSVATQFEPQNNDYIYVPDVLASNVDRSIADRYDSDTGKVFRRWKTGFLLAGDLAWVYHSSGADGTYKIVRIPQLPTAFSNSSMIANCVKYNGNLIQNMYAGTTTEVGADKYRQNTTDTFFYLNVLNSESGWTTNIHPYSNAVKALMNGWKATANNGTAYTAWASILDGSLPTTNTDAWCAANKAPGWTGWATLDYVLAQPIEEPLIGDTGAIGLHAGGNQLELLEGVVVREEIVPVYYATGDYYYINDEDIVGGKTKYKSNRILAIYKNDNRDEWEYVTTGRPYGKQRARVKGKDFDPKAKYTATYEVLDRHAYSANVIDTALQYRTNPEMVQRKLVLDVTDLETQVGINVLALAELYKKVKALGG